MPDERFHVETLHFNTWYLAERAKEIKNNCTTFRKKKKNEPTYIFQQQKKIKQAFHSRSLAEKNERRRYLKKSSLSLNTDEKIP